MVKEPGRWPVTYLNRQFNPKRTGVADTVHAVKQRDSGKGTRKVFLVHKCTRKRNKSSAQAGVPRIYVTQRDMKPEERKTALTENLLPIQKELNYRVKCTTPQEHSFSAAPLVPATSGTWIAVSRGGYRRISPLASTPARKRSCHGQHFAFAWTSWEWQPQFAPLDCIPFHRNQGGESEKNHCLQA